MEGGGGGKSNEKGQKSELAGKRVNFQWTDTEKQLQNLHWSAALLHFCRTWTYGHKDIYAKLREKGEGRSHPRDRAWSSTDKQGEMEERRDDEQRISSDVR